MKESLNTAEAEQLSPKEEYVLKLLYFRDDWEKEAQTKNYSQIDGHSQWFVGIAADTENALSEGILTEKGSDLAKDYLAWYSDIPNDQYPIIDDPHEVERTKMFIQQMINSFYPNHIEESDNNTKNLIDHLSYLKLFFNEVPDRIVHSKDGPWKIRSMWFIGIATDLANARTEEILPISLKDEVDEFLEWYIKDFGTRPGDPVINTKEDIKKGDQIIDKVLESLGASKT